MSRRALNLLIVGSALPAAMPAADARAAGSESLDEIRDHLAIEELVYRYAVAIDDLDAGHGRLFCG